MLSPILSPEVQEFILDNTASDLRKLALRKNPFPNIEWAEILNQIAARAKAKDKLPSWFAAKNIIYPPKISIEQTSSETAAAYKAGLVSGESLIDLTGGFGVDDYYFAKKIRQVVHCEMNAGLSVLAAHNFKVLDAAIECIPGDSLKTLERLNRQWDWIYIDPSRRNDARGKVFLLKDCLPNVPGLLETYFKYSGHILIKTAPLLDISAGLGELHSVKEIHIVAVNNEVKELLWLLEKGFTGSPLLHAVSITKEDTAIFTAPFDNDGEAVHSLPQKYLYEPNSAIMKSGAFNRVGRQYNLGKLHRHSQLYTGNKLICFPGRRFVINEVIPYGKAEMKQHVEGKKMNVTVRNFPDTAEALRKKWKIRDGGELYSFFTTNSENAKIVLLCTKI